MEMNLGYTQPSIQPRVKFWPVYTCFLIFGILIPLSRSDAGVLTFITSILLAALIGFAAVNVLIMMLNNGNKMLSQETGGQLAREAVAAGMLFMIPFTVLAVLAQLLLGWNAVMPFASAAIMTATASAGTEVMKRGAQGIKNIMLPSLLAFVLSTGWMMLVGILP